MPFRGADGAESRKWSNKGLKVASNSDIGHLNSGRAMMQNVVTAAPFVMGRDSFCGLMGS